MFEQFSEYDKILVTGPHRSGTRICAQMIARDTDHQYFDEADIEMDSLYKLANLLKYETRFVVQCPALCRYIHLFGRMNSTAIILMRRNLNDIIASQQRIHWNNEWLELGKYGETTGSIAAIKYHFWDTEQKKQILHAFEVDYESLAQHPLWISKSARRDFWPIQTTVRETMRFRPHANVFLRIEEDGVILTRNSGNSSRLNKTGQVIWSLLGSAPTFQEILSELEKEFGDIDSLILRQELSNFIYILIENGMISPVPAKNTR